ncbi:hypothetical protein [Salinarchaeum laminariae]|uniref:hypothetical protein n=1 Tax=Salinarchaeum laminariae TaxID=869888 RepID=UPI0020BF46E5|nr:hypothetical protein [Salinarchaeum laminariae]
MAVRCAIASHSHAESFPLSCLLSGGLFACSPEHYYYWLGPSHRFGPAGPELLGLV